jgi:hypothetical protein
MTILAATAAAAAGAPAAARAGTDIVDRGVHAAQAPDATLPSRCADQQAAPVSMVILCGDAGVVARDLVWHDWGAARAWASGTASVNTCDPSCAAGKREERPIVLTAGRLVDCKYGRPQYTRITYSLADSAGSGTAQENSVSFACPRHADPRIRRMRVSLTRHRTSGDRELVLTRLRLRVCAARGDLRVAIKEFRRLGGRTVRARRHTRTSRQTERCQWHAFSWKLRRVFSGAGAYVVAATVWDKDGQSSATVSREIPALG